MDAPNFKFMVVSFKLGWEEIDMGLSANKELMGSVRNKGLTGSDRK